MPGSFKEFLPDRNIPEVLIKNLDICALEIEKKSVAKNLIYLGMEPEPLGLFENTPETVSFFDHLFGKQATKVCVSGLG